MFQHEIVINKVKEMRFSISSWLHILHASFKLCFQNLGLFAFQKLSSFISVIHYHSIELFDFFNMSKLYSFYIFMFALELCKFRILIWWVYFFSVLND